VRLEDTAEPVPPDHRDDERAMTTHTSSRTEQNSELTRALRDATDERREELVEALTVLNMDVARTIARRFARRGESLADLEQIAYLALLRSARAFDPARGDHFLPYAVVWMRGELRHFFRDEVWVIRPSRSVQTRHNDLRKGGTNCVDGGVAIETCYRPMSLDVTVGGSGDLTLGSFVADDGDDRLDRVELRESLRPYLAALPPRARTVLHLRYVQDRTQGEIGDILGISQVHVSRLLSRHLAELRTALEGTAA
jgi:RNA polymerase sigma-B factor